MTKSAQFKINKRMNMLGTNGKWIPLCYYKQSDCITIIGNGSTKIEVPYK